MSYFPWACLAANGWRVVLPNLNCRKTYGGWGEPGAALDRKFRFSNVDLAIDMAVFFGD